MYHYWERVLRVTVGSHLFSFPSSLKMARCQIRTASSAWILEWRKCGTEFQWAWGLIPGQCGLTGGDTPISCPYEMTYGMSKKSTFTVVATESLMLFVTGITQRKLTDTASACHLFPSVHTPWFFSRALYWGIHYPQLFWSCWIRATSLGLIILLAIN